MQGPMMVVENRSGASTVIGTEAASRATPDGNTILMQGDNFVINAILHPSSVTYNPLTSFDPICLLTNVPQVLVVNSSSAFHSLADFLAAAKSASWRVTLRVVRSGNVEPHCRRVPKARRKC
jgi:tripartite-type tricarboxylate transporter receptor subunit TctC